MITRKTPIQNALRRAAIVAAVFALAGCVTVSREARYPGPSSPYGGKLNAIPGLIEAEHYDDGEPDAAYHDLDNINEGANYRGATHVDIEARPDASNGHGIGWTRAGEWLVYTVKVQKSGLYSVEFPVASNKKGGTFHLEIEGKDVSGPIDVPDTGSWQKLQTIRKEGVRLEKGVYALKLVMDSNGPSGSIADIDYLKFELAR